MFGVPIGLRLNLKAHSFLTVLQPYNNGDRNFLLSSALAANVRRRHFSLAALPYDHGRVACLISCEATALCSFNFVDNRVCFFDSQFMKDEMRFNIHQVLWNVQNGNRSFFCSSALVAFQVAIADDITKGGRNDGNDDHRGGSENSGDGGGDKDEDDGGSDKKDEDNKDYK
ncbi:hypothetical protein SDJN03_07943, partial [Cucurbita argyrosperma subsp. sororia]